MIIGITPDSFAGASGFRTLIDHLDGVAIWIVSAPGEFDYISAGFEDIWGIPPEAVLDDVSRFLERIHPEDRDRVRSLVEQPERNASEESYESRVVQPDGTVRWIRVKQVPVRDDEETLTEVVGITTDVTEQKRREQELEALNRVLRHDVRNDMSVILGWAELLEEQVDDDGEDHLRKIRTAGRHIVELTEIARDYVETVSGEEEMTVEPTPLAPTLENEIDRRRESFPEAEFRLTGPIPDVDVTANEMLPSVFRNLLNNAVQHNDRAEPVVEIGCEVDEETVAVRVADNGPGIPDEQKESVFGDGEKGLDSPGTGIGLYLVRTLVEQYGGNVRVEDNEPTGTVFTVRLPRAGGS